MKKSSVYIRTFMSISLLMSVFSCSDNDPQLRIPAAGFKIDDKEMHELVLAELKNRNIPYVAEDGGILYFAQNEAEVLGIKREIEYGKELNKNHWESLPLIDQFEQEKYERAFKNSGIPYKIRHHQGGVVSIDWRQTFGPKVDELRQKMSESRVVAPLGR